MVREISLKHKRPEAELKSKLVALYNGPLL